MPLVPLATRAPPAAAVSSPAERLQTKQPDDAFHTTYPSVYRLTGPPQVAHVVGTYHVRRRTVHGFPIWVHEQGMVIFSDSNSGWTVGETMKSLKTGDGVISSQHAHSGALPHVVPTWCYGTGRTWVACAGIEFVPSWTTVGEPIVPPCFAAAAAPRITASTSCASVHSSLTGGAGVDPAAVGSISDFQVDYPRAFGASCLTSRELRYLKQCYDEEAASLPLQPSEGEEDIDALLKTLHRIGIDDVDAPAVEQALAEARRATAHMPSPPAMTGGLRTPMALTEFIMLCDVLKAQKQQQNQNVSNRETLEAFVAMGGNSDRSGGVSLAHLKSTALTFDIDMASGAGPATIDYTDFNSMLAADGYTPDDVFAMAGGNPADPEMAVAFSQLRIALDTLKEVGALAYPDRLLLKVARRFGERSVLTKEEFIVAVWKPLELPHDPEESDGAASMRSQEISMNDDGNTIAGLASMLRRQRRGSRRDDLDSTGLLLRFDNLCKRAQVVLGRPGAQCPFYNAPHVLQLDHELIGRACDKMAAGARGGVFKRRILGLLRVIAQKLETHDSDCKVCEPPPQPPQRSYMAPRTYNLPKDTSPTPLHPADTPPLSSKPSKGGRQNWKLQPAPPPPAQRAKVFSRTRGGSVETEEFMDPVYVDRKGRPVPVPPTSSAGAGVGADDASGPSSPRAPRPAATHNPAAATFGFLTRMGNRMGAIPPGKAARNKRRRQRAEGARSSSPAPTADGQPPPAEGELVAADVAPPATASGASTASTQHRRSRGGRAGSSDAPPPPGPALRDAQRCVRVHLKRKDCDDALGMILTRDLLLKGLAKGSVASRCCIDQLLGWRLTHVDEVAVHSLKEVDTLMDNQLALEVTFRMPSRPQPSPYAAPPVGAAAGARGGGASDERRGLPDLSKTSIEQMPPKTIFQMLSQYRAKPRVSQQPQSGRGVRDSRRAVRGDTSAQLL